MKATKKNKGSVFHRVKQLFKKKLYTAAVILVGGSSSRFGTDIPKQLMDLDGIPVVAHSLLAFQKNELIDEIVVVCREGEQDHYYKMATQYGIDKLHCVVAGGETRQHSALKGVSATSDTAQYVLIHDGARPLVSDNTICDVIFASHDHKAACAAIRSKDTVKIADSTGFIHRTEDRDHVYLAATPQGFYKILYEACAHSALKDGVEVTDDASLLEHYFYKVKLVESNADNIKVTFPSDLIVAEALLKKRNQTNT